MFWPYGFNQNINAVFYIASFFSRWILKVLEMNVSLVIACLLRVPDGLSVHFWDTDIKLSIQKYKIVDFKR